MTAYPGSVFCAKKELLVDPYYSESSKKFTIHLLYGGVNSSTANKALNDMRGGGIEFEFEKMSASGFFSGVIGLGYINLDDSSSSREHYLKSPFLKGGFNFFAFSSPRFMNVKLGPDIRLTSVSVTNKNNETESHFGLGFGLNLAIDVSIKPKWFVGGGIREGILNFGNEELTTRYLFLNLQRTF